MSVCLAARPVNEANARAQDGIGPGVEAQFPPLVHPPGAVPVAILALVLYPLVRLLLLFRIAGMAVGGVLELPCAVASLPARVLRGPRHFREKR